MTDDFATFIEKNRDVDPARLRMRFRGDSRDWLPLAISHIEALRKGRKKFPDLPDSWIFPSVTAVEQATPVRTAAYNLKVAASRVGCSLAECQILDMTAGLGMDARGFAEAGASLTLLELNHPHAQALAHNFSKYPNVKVAEGDSVQWLKEYAGKPFNIIFIDPARRTDSGARAYNLHDCTPDLIEIAPLILDKARIGIAKLSPMLDITQTLRDLPACNELHVVEEGGECRELLAVMSVGNSDSAPVTVVHKEGYTWICDTGQHGVSSFGIPEKGMFLLEPSPAVAKGMPPAQICGYGLKMLAPNSHLFVGDEIAEPALGRWSRIERVMDFAGSKLRKIGGEICAAEVIARNLPGMTSDSLRKRLAVKESSDRRIIGTSLADGSKILLLTGKRL